MLRVPHKRFISSHSQRFGRLARGAGIEGGALGDVKSGLP